MSSHPARCRLCASPKYSGQAAQSQIIVNAHRINQGGIPDLRKPEAESDFYFVEADDPEAAVSRIIELAAVCN